MSARRLWRALGIGLIGAIWPFSGFAQVAGIGALLNPEGSRLFPQPVVYPRHPGKPDPRWKTFQWRYVDRKADSTKYRLYFYRDEEWPARFAIPKIDEEIESLNKIFQYSPSKSFSYLLFTSLREFRQANIFFITEGVQGITSTQEATMAIPYWGQAKEFNHVSKHELVHQFQVQKITDLTDFFPEETMAQIPLWFIEGMAEYYSLDGIDSESRYYIRDLILYPDPTKEYRLPKFFEEGQMGFVNTYKVGQTKIAFLEDQFGKGIAQKILEAAAKRLSKKAGAFREVVSTEVGHGDESIERLWVDYVNRTFKPEADRLRQPMDAFEPVSQTGETLDLFDLSPDGTLMAAREIDPMTGVTSINLYDLKKNYEKHEVIHDNQPSTITLYFFQIPNIALANKRIAYIAEATSGPELAIRDIKRDSEGNLEIGPEFRVKLHQRGIIQASSPTISPDGHRMAFVGLTAKGWANVYAIDFPNGGALESLRQLTDGYYGWKTVTWSRNGILASADKTSNGNYALFRIRPKSGDIRQLTVAENDQFAADVENAKGEFVYQGWNRGSSQIYRYSGGKSVQLTEGKTYLGSPKLRGDTLYALGFMGGRYRLLKISKFLPGVALKKDVTPTAPGEPWKARLASLEDDEINRYLPFVSSGVRMDSFGGFFASGTVFGLSGQVSDLMRDYSLAGEISVIGSFRFTTADVFLTSHRGRTTWTLGAYHVVQPRLDSIFPANGTIRTYLHREFGTLGMIEYPLGFFGYFDTGLRVAGVNRSDFSDSSLETEWEAQNPGVEFMLAPVFRIGYDRIQYELYSGPLKGWGVLFESDTSLFPSRGSATQRFRLDYARYTQLVDRMVLAVQALGGIAFGGTFKDPFLVSSDDILRGYFFGDERLYGNYLLAGKAELRFPIGSLFGFPPLRGLAAYDLGTVYQQPGQAIDYVASSATAGFSFNIPPLAMNFLFSYPLRVAPGPVDRPIVHFTLRYLYL